MDLFCSSLQFAFKLNTLMFPLDSYTLLKELEENEFVQVRKGQATLDGLPVKQGDIAMKGNTLLNVNQQTQTISISGTRTDEIISIFHELIPLLERSGINLEEKVASYSIVGEYIIKTEESPIKKIQKFSSIKELKSLTEITGGEHGSFSIMITPKGTSFIDDEYFNLRVEPHFQSLGKSYFLQFSRRVQDRTSLEEIMTNMEDHVTSIINEIES